jgi:NAD(P)-dependent dehydrogenase (short-subunit alcohol dehydrogenase family)
VRIITGGARGLGAAIAERLATEGAQIFVADICYQRAQVQAARLAARGAQAQALPLDVSDSASAGHMAQSVLEAAGRIDILVNNAGVSGPSAPAAAYPQEHWRRVLDVDLSGVLVQHGRCVRTIGRPGNLLEAAYQLGLSEAGPERGGSPCQPARLMGHK